MIIIGIDNGVSGAITILDQDTNEVHHINTPVKKELSYTKKKQWINRIDHDKLKLFLRKKVYVPDVKMCLIERPMVNPGRHKATLSAIRALEATLIVLESLNIPYEYIDSKEWQKALLPKGLEKGELKKAALNVAGRLFPGMKILNADSLLIAEYGRRKFNPSGK